MTASVIENKEEKLKAVKDFIASTKDKEHSESYLIAALHKTQEVFGYLPTEILDEVAYEMKIPTAHIWGVATFYHYFSLKPKGKYVISICLGTACFVKGAEKVMDAIKQELKINVGGTTEDKLFTLQEARCLGACGLAPVIMINDKIYGNLTAESVVKILRDIKKSEK